jgi:GPI mannosyltransferase 3
VVGTAGVALKRFFEGPWPFALLTGVVAFGTAMISGGRVHPDEIFQNLEPAHRLAFGYGEVTWEWVEGIRNWAVPGALGGLLATMGKIGIEHPRVLVAGLWILCSLWQGLGTLAVYWVVEKLGGPFNSARLAALLHATWGGFAIYAARTLCDPIAIPPLLWSLLFALNARREDRLSYGCWAGALLGLTVIVRYPSLVFLIPFALSFLFARTWRALAGLACGLAVAMTGLGVLDAATWGHPLHSLSAYLAFNSPLGDAVSRFGAQPWWYYAPIFAGMAFLPLLFPFQLGLRKPNLAQGCFFIYLLAIQVHPHKEPRFLLPLLPLMTICAAGEACELLESSRRWRDMRINALAAGVYAAWSFAAASWFLPFSFHREMIQADVVAGRDPSLKALLVGTTLWRTGGRFYLHRNVPEAYANGAELSAKLDEVGFSHLIVDMRDEPSLTASRLSTAGWKAQWSDGTVSIWKR